MVSETREFIPILIFLGLYCTDSIWFLSFQAFRPIQFSGQAAASVDGNNAGDRGGGHAEADNRKSAEKSDFWKLYRGWNDWKNSTTRTGEESNFFVEIWGFLFNWHMEKTTQKVLQNQQKLLVLRLFLPRTGHLHLQRCFGRGLCPQPQRFQVIGHWHRIHGNKLRPYEYPILWIVMKISRKTYHYVIVL